ncbi:MAG: RelA/SpoT domain-containing protein, partial [Thermoplasmata archaeon]
GRNYWVLEKRWTGPHKGPRGGTYWLNSESGEQVYQQERPGTREPASQETTKVINDSATEAMKELDFGQVLFTYAMFDPEKETIVAHRKAGSHHSAEYHLGRDEGSEDAAAYARKLDREGVHIILSRVQENDPAHQAGASTEDVYLLITDERPLTPENFDALWDAAQAAQRMLKRRRIAGFFNSIDSQWVPLDGEYTSPGAAAMSVARSGGKVTRTGSRFKVEKQGTLTSATLGNYTPRTRTKVFPNVVLENRAYWVLKKAWEPYTGPKGGRGWRQGEEIRYQTEKPSEREEGERLEPEGVHATPEEALQAASAMESGATITRTEEGFEVKPRPEMGAPIEVYGDYVEQFRPMFTKAFDGISGEFGEENVRGRLKSPQSLKEKVEVRAPGRRASDILGYMVLADDYEGLEDVRQRVRDKYNVVEEDERFLFDPGAGYYRAVHFLVETEGTVAEVQVMTRRMQQLKEWGHKYIYKGARGEEEAFRGYAREVGEWVDTMDRGEDAGALPACPPELEEEGLCLPF